jgi:ElaA protein
MKQQWFLKTFQELQPMELYNILRLRSSIFVIDQQCIFEEIDGKDIDQCYHLFNWADDVIVAYARIFPPHIVYQECCIGRICTSLHHRGKGLGRKLVEEALRQSGILFPEAPIKIAAQYYLLQFYESFGFRAVGERFLEDNIEHIYMVKELSAISNQQTASLL